MNSDHLFHRLLELECALTPELSRPATNRWTRQADEVEYWAEAVPGEAAEHEWQRKEAVRGAGGVGADEQGMLGGATTPRASAGDELR